VTANEFLQRLNSVENDINELYKVHRILEHIHAMKRAVKDVLDGPAVDTRVALVGDVSTTECDRDQHTFNLIAWNRHEIVGHHCLRCGKFRPVAPVKKLRAEHGTAEPGQH